MTTRPGEDQAAIGAIGAGRVEPTILVTAAVFVVGVLAAAFSPVFAVLLAARIVIGLAVGSASMVVPMYIGEAAPPKYRGDWSASTSWPLPRGSWSPTWSTTACRPPGTGA